MFMDDSVRSAGSSTLFEFSEFYWFWVNFLIVLGLPNFSFFSYYWPEEYWELFGDFFMKEFDDVYDAGVFF